jgi:3-oxoacyl-[acyl-carrier-protein] synthase-3
MNDVLIENIEFMKIKISAIAYHLPAKAESVEVLKADNPDWDMPKIFEKTGIVTRYISAPDETASDLAYEAGMKIFKQINSQKIDLLILVTQSPAYALPTTACILQNRFGLSTNCMAFDVNLGCSGFVYALSIAGSLIESGVVKKGLILCSDTYTKYISKNDRTCRPIFSDGAAAILVEKSEGNSIGPFEFGTDGSGSGSLIVKDKTLEMQGGSVFLFTMRVVPQSINNLLAKASLTLEDIDLVIFHQASKIVIEALIDQLKLDRKKVFTNYESIGNTVSATIPIALQDASSQGRLKKGDKVMVVGFGVGFSWGATLINWTI